MTTDGTIRKFMRADATIDAPGGGYARVFAGLDGQDHYKQSDGSTIVPYTGKPAASAHADPWFDASAYGTIDKTGVANSTAAFAAAKAAALASPRGGYVWAPAGVYLVDTGTIDFSSSTNPFRFGGSDRALTVIIPNGTGDIVKFGGSDGCSVTDIAFFSSGATQTAGNAIHTNGADDLLIDNVLFNNQFVDIFVDNTSLKVSMQRCVSTRSVNNGATSVGVLVTNGAAGDTYIGPDFVFSDTGSTRRRACIEVTQSGHFEVNQVNATGSAQGLLVDPGAGQIVADFFVNHSLFDSNSVNGVTLSAPTATSTIKSGHFINAWFSGTVTITGGAGFVSSGTAGGIINGIEFVSCRALNNQTHGYQHGFGTDFRWLGGKVGGNSAASSNVSDGINVAAGVSNFSIIGVKSGGTDGASTGGNQRWGIFVAVGASDNYTITGNDCTGNNTGGVSDSGTGLNKYVDANLPGPYRQARRLTADSTAITATTATDIAGLAFNVVPGSNYTFAFECFATNTAVTGHKYAIAVPAGSTITAVIFGALSATTFRQDPIVASATLSATALATVATTMFHHRIVGVCTAPTAPGVCKLQAAVVTAGSLVHKAGTSFVATPCMN